MMDINSSKVLKVFAEIQNFNIETMKSYKTRQRGDIGFIYKQTSVTMNQETSTLLNATFGVTAHAALNSPRLH
jgi:hypothetical protein